MASWTEPDQARGDQEPTLTAAICTRERPRGLERALESLDSQRNPPAQVVVVENAPDPLEANRAVLAAYPEVHHVLEPRQGLDFARNRALGEARGDVVAFLDDDVVLDPGWCGALRRAFREHPEVGLCTGRVKALALETRGQRLFEANGGYDRGPEPLVLPAPGRARLGRLPAPAIAWAVSVGNGSSLAVRRKLALELGGFAQGLDLGPFLPAGGDHDLLWRVLCAGHRVRYEPEALSYHEHRRELDAVHHQIVHQQRGLVAMLTKAALETRGRRRWGVLVFWVWRLLKPGVRLVRRMAGLDPLPAPVLASMWWHAARGPASYVRGRREARRRRAAPVP
jgi:glycosyltransferase involved in cell wall biosynthesis